MKRFRNAQGGFTLMELMVVIVIVAILAAVAVPLYINYVNDARDTEAKGAIGAIVTAEQTFRQSSPTNTYQMDITQLNVDLTDVTTRWTFAIAAAGTGFSITATNVANNAHTVAYTYPPAAPPADPWSIDGK